jgi:hypothetical protein
MPQTKQTGHYGHAWGRKTFRRIADYMGVEILSTKSNECMFEGKRIVIKCAGPNTTSIGVYYTMLDRLDFIVAAWETEIDTFEIFRLTKRQFINYIREGGNYNTIATVSLCEFNKKENYITTIKLL